jgi:hypothetical protein
MTAPRHAIVFSARFFPSGHCFVSSDSGVPFS